MWEGRSASVRCGDTTSWGRRHWSSWWTRPTTTASTKRRASCTASSTTATCAPSSWPSSPTSRYELMSNVWVTYSTSHELFKRAASVASQLDCWRICEDETRGCYKSYVLTSTRTSTSIRVLLYSYTPVRVAIVLHRTRRVRSGRTNWSSASSWVLSAGARRWGCSGRALRTATASRRASRGYATSSRRRSETSRRQTQTQTMRASTPLPQSQSGAHFVQSLSLLPASRALPSRIIALVHCVPLSLTRRWSILDD